LSLRVWAEEPRQRLYLLTVDGPILPITATYLDRGIGRAEEEGGIAVILLDTPGGLVEATRKINQRIFASRAPVVVYVWPAGARAASAGVYLLYAAHVAAMAPGTHLGAATPITLGEGPPDEGARRKMIEDMAAYARNLAQRRGRNPEWVEQSVRQGVSLTAQEAASRRVIDLLASDLQELSRELQGREVELAGGARVVLRPAGGPPVEVPMSAPERFFLVLSDPQLALILVMIGVYGIVYGLLTPGTYVPEVVGSICLVLGLYALGTLPISYAGLGLVLLAVGFFIAELKAPVHGALAAAGVVALVLGGLLLIPAGHPYLQISRTLLVSLALFSGLFFTVILGGVARTMRRPPLSGVEAMRGALGRVRTPLDPEGQVLVRGELWNARCPGARLAPGSRVRVVGCRGLTLEVEPVEAPDTKEAD
jgi:membrane-bound serine protease (ClpP class)